MWSGHRTLGKLMVQTKIGISGQESDSSMLPDVARTASGGAAEMPGKDVRPVLTHCFQETIPR